MRSPWDESPSARRYERSEALRKLLTEAYNAHGDLLHPDVLHASEALDEEILRLTHGYVNSSFTRRGLAKRRRNQR